MRCPLCPLLPARIFPTVPTPEARSRLPGKGPESALRHCSGPVCARQCPGIGRAWLRRPGLARIGAARAASWVADAAKTVLCHEPAMLDRIARSAPAALERPGADTREVPLMQSHAATPTSAVLAGLGAAKPSAPRRPA